MTRSLLTLLMLSLAACGRSGRETPLPPLPDVELERFEPAVRRQLQEALDAARGQPRSGAVNRRLGMLLHAYGWLPQAGVCYERATVLAPDDLGSHYYRARIQMESGETRAARETLERAVTSTRGGGRGDAPTLSLLGTLSLQEGDLEAARRWFDLALDLSPASPEALVGIGQVRFASGDAGGAIEAYRRALEIAPEFRQAAYRLALAYRAQGEIEEARRYLAEHARGTGGYRVADPHMEKLDRLRIDAEHVYRKANRLAKSGRSREAIQLYTRVLELNPRFVAARYNIALAFLRLEKPADAASHLTRFLQQRPDHVDAHNNLGLCFLGLGRYDDAAGSFDRALAIDPGYYKAHFNLGICRWRQRDAERAKRHLRDALAVRPAYPAAYLNLALLLEEEGDRDASLEQLIAALDIEPEHEGAHAALLRVFGRAGHETRARERAIAHRRVASFLYGKRRFAAAIHVLRTAGDGDDWRSAVTLAWILATCPDRTLRRPDEAVRLMEPICREKAPEDPTSLDTLGAAYAAAGRFEDARGAARAAMELAATTDRRTREHLRERIGLRLRMYEQNQAFYEK